MSYQYSLNNLRTNSPYYSLNNLNTENGIKSISAVPPIIVATTGADSAIELYESSPNVIGFSTYNKSLDVVNINATTSIYSVGSLNAPNAFIDCNGINSIGSNPIRTTNNFTGSQIFVNTGTFSRGIKTQNITVDGNATINNLIINGATIPYFNFTVATGTTLYTSNLYSTMMSGTNGYFNRINTTIPNRFTNEQIEATSSVITPSINVSSAFISSQNSTNLELCSNADLVYIRQGTADTSGQIVFDPTISQLASTTAIHGFVDTSDLKWALVATGATAHIQDCYIQNLYARNTVATGTFKGNFKVKNADTIEFQASNGSQICQITPSATTTPPSLSYSTTALVGSQLQMTMTTGGTTLSQINDVSSQTSQVFTRADIKQASINYNGSIVNDLTVNGKASIGYLTASPTNGLIVSGNSSFGTASNVNKVDIASGVAIGSYAGVNTAPSNGMIISGNTSIGTASNVNKLDVSGGMAIGSYAGANSAPSNGLLVSGNTSLGTSSNVNKLDVSGGTAIGSYAGANSAPTNGLIVSGNVGIGTTSAGQQLTVASDASVSNGLWSNRINIGGTLSTANKGFELDVKGYQRFYSHTNSNGFQLDIGSSGPYSNFRSGFFYKPDASFSSDKTLYIVNADGADPTNTYRGAIQLAPNNASLGNITCYGNGNTVFTANANDYCIKTLQNANNGYGLRVDCPYNGTYLAQFNGKIDSGSFETIMTLHAEGGNNGMLVLGAYPVSPSNAFKLWIAPPKNNSVQDTYIGITNQTFRANGTLYLGMSTGGVCDILSTTSINHIDISPNGSQRTRFAGNGEIFLNGQSTSSSSVLNSTMTLTSVSYNGGGGTSYYSTHGLGNFIPLVNVYHNGGFAIGAGTNLLASTEYYRTNHSAWIVAGGVQKLNCDWTGKYEILANVCVQMDTQYALAGYILYINGGGYTYQYQTNAVNNGYVSMNINQVIQLSTGDTIQFYLYVSAGNAYVIGGSNVSMRYVG